MTVNELDGLPKKTQNDLRLHGYTTRQQIVAQWKSAPFMFLKLPTIGKITYKLLGEWVGVWKDCAFQYATERRIIEDQSNLTLDEAIALWVKYIDDFQERLEDSPEMAVWINMKHESDYHTKFKYLCADTCIIKNGYLYSLERVCTK
jgi:hypothetical protein